MPVPRAIVVVMFSLASTCALSADGDADGIEFFERKVRPLFADHCFSCHGEEKQKGKLRLDSPAAIRKGGESGEEIVPGEPEKSRLIVAVGTRMRTCKCRRKSV